MDGGSNCKNKATFSLVGAAAASNLHIQILLSTLVFKPCTYLFSSPSTETRSLSNPVAYYLLASDTSLAL